MCIICTVFYSVIYTIFTSSHYSNKQTNKRIYKLLHTIVSTKLYKLISENSTKVKKLCIVNHNHNLYPRIIKIGLSFYIYCCNNWAFMLCKIVGMFSIS